MDPKFISVRHVDDPKDLVYEVAPAHIARAIRRRFDNEPRPVVLHPDKENVFIFDPGNFWDGPTHVTYEPESGTFFFSSWGGDQHFPLIGPIH